MPAPCIPASVFDRRGGPLDSPIWLPHSAKPRICSNPRLHTLRNILSCLSALPCPHSRRHSGAARISVFGPYCLRARLYRLRKNFRLCLWEGAGGFGPLNKVNGFRGFSPGPFARSCNQPSSRSLFNSCKTSCRQERPEAFRPDPLLKLPPQPLLWVPHPSRSYCDRGPR